MGIPTIHQRPISGTYNSFHLVKTLYSPPSKVAKCTFERFGPSGTIEVFDGLCVLPINIINEKIYIFLWFWFILLGRNSIELHHENLFNFK